MAPDPDLPGVAFSAESARVLQVDEYPVRMSDADSRKAFASVDLTQYDAYGYLAPAGEFMEDLVALGLTKEICRTFPQWANPHRVVFNSDTEEFVYMVDDVTLAYSKAYRALLHESGVDGELPDDVQAVFDSDEFYSEIVAMTEYRPTPWI